MGLLLPFWPLLPLLSPRPSPRLMLTPTFSMVDMVDMDLDILAMLAATMDMVLDIMVLASVRLSLRLMLTPTVCTEDTTDMVLDTMVLDTEFMESALLMLSQKLTPTFCMEDMLDTMDMPDTMDTPMVDMPTLDKLFPLISKWTANHPCFLFQ